VILETYYCCIPTAMSSVWCGPDRVVRDAPKDRPTSFTVRVDGKSLEVGKPGESAVKTLVAWEKSVDTQKVSEHNTQWVVTATPPDNADPPDSMRRRSGTVGPLVNTK
jgi:hypothetical protein